MNETMWPLAVYIAAVFAVIPAMLGMSYVLGERHERKPDRRGESGVGQPYESGMNPTGSAHMRLSVQYYLVAMLFVIFDVEAVFLYAWSVAVPETGWTGFIEMSVFVGILLVALVYLWRIGALDWGMRYQQRHTTDKRREGVPDVHAAQQGEGYRSAG